MTDANLMDADCIHGVAWYECLECDQFGDDTDTEFTNERIATELLAYICDAGLPHTGDDPTQDHGHTQCMWIGLAIQRLRAMP